MGEIFTSQRTTTDQLEELDKEIRSLEASNRVNLDRQKRIIGSLILYSVLLYVTATLLFYFFYLPERWRDRLKYCVPLVIFPFLVWTTKRFFHWYFVKRISENESSLEVLKDQRNSLLEDVMENETYKKAKEILEKYDPERFRQFQLQYWPDTTHYYTRDNNTIASTTIAATPMTSSSPISSTAAGTSVMATPLQSRAPPGHEQQQLRQRMTSTPAPAAVAGSPGGRPGMTQRPPPGPPTPRPILPRERSTVDKLMEYLVGDGPQNRYALICRQCQSHNGMALREEFEYIAYRCCYCHSMNPARKQRPRAPRLDLLQDTTNAPRDHNEEDAVAGPSTAAQPEVTPVTRASSDNITAAEDVANAEKQDPVAKKNS